jgi:hypothetical protein
MENDLDQATDDKLDVVGPDRKPAGWGGMVGLFATAFRCAEWIARRHENADWHLIQRELKSAS